MPRCTPNWEHLARGTDAEVRTCSKHLSDKLLNKLKADGHQQVVDRFVKARKENARLNRSSSGAETIARVQKEFAHAKRDVYKALAGTCTEFSSVAGDLHQAQFDLLMAEPTIEGTGKRLRDHSMSYKSVAAVPEPWKQKILHKRARRKPLTERLSYLRKQLVKKPDHAVFKAELQTKQEAQRALDQQIARLFEEAAARLDIQADCVGAAPDKALEDVVSPLPRQAKHRRNCLLAAPVESEQPLVTGANENQQSALYAMKVDWATWLGSDLTHDGSDTDLDFTDIEEEEDSSDMSDNELCDLDFDQAQILGELFAELSQAQVAVACHVLERKRFQDKIGQLEQQLERRRERRLQSRLRRMIQRMLQRG